MTGSNKENVFFSVWILTTILTALVLLLSFGCGTLPALSGVAEGFTSSDVLSPGVTVPLGPLDGPGESPDPWYYVGAVLAAIVTAGLGYWRGQQRGVR